MNLYRLSGIALATLMALYGANVMASHSVEVEQKYGARPLYKGKAGKPSQYRGNRITAGLEYKGGPYGNPGSYAVELIDAQDKGAGKLNSDGFKGNLEHNVPFSNAKHRKIVGLYVPEVGYSIYGDQSLRYPAELVPAQNVTHVFYSFLGLCDYDKGRPTSVTLKASHNARVQSATDQQLLKLACENTSDFNVTKSGSVKSFYMLDAIKRMKLANPQLKAMASIGGTQLSSPFHGMAETAEGRAIFVQSVIRLLRENPMIDGVDLAWEFVGGNASAFWIAPANGERQNVGYAKHGYEVEKARYTELVKALRTALDQNFTGAQRKTLSAAVSADPAKLAAIDFEALKNDFDFVNLMSYGLYGGWDHYPTHQAGVHAKPLITAYANRSGNRNEVADEINNPILFDGKKIEYRELWRKTSTEGAIKTILDNNPNFPSEKLVIGAAAQSRGWHSVRVLPEQDKFFWHGVAAGEKGHAGVRGTFKNGASDFREVYDEYMTGDAAHLYYDKQAQAAYTWVPKSPQDGYNVAQVDSFDDPRSVLAKGKLVQEYNLGGMFSENAAADNGLIVNAMNAAVCNIKADGRYYTFSQKYAGEVDTVVVRAVNDVAQRVRETLSGPTTFHFDDAAARELCGDPESVIVIKSTPMQLGGNNDLYESVLSAHLELDGNIEDSKDREYTWQLLPTSAPGGTLLVKGHQAILAARRDPQKDLTFFVRVEAKNNSSIVSGEHTVVLPSASKLPYPDYQPGIYKGGEIVKGKDGKLYQCKPYPESGWCGQAPDTYAPGQGSKWTDAWGSLSKLNFHSKLQCNTTPGLNPAFFLGTQNNINDKIYKNNLKLFKEFSYKFGKNFSYFVLALTSKIDGLIDFGAGRPFFRLIGKKRIASEQLA